MINEQTIAKVASLARLNLSPRETQAMAGQLGSILEYVDQLNKVDTTNVEPTCFIVPEHDPLRNDEVHPSLSQDEILRNGPSVKKKHFAVPKVIE
jgi:aspartyl-tRNA(Asn)/glutamyl-tRNA(Gln) amidotransferase subunit C